MTNLKNEREPYTIRGMAAQTEDRYIVVLDAQDLSDWLRSELHNLSDAERQFTNEIADHIDTFALAVLNRDLEEVDAQQADGMMES
jgi:hypothetical protein